MLWGQGPRPEADYFHDGSNVLEAVLHWHDTVRQYIRQPDVITRRVLDLVKEKMLLGDPNKRINAAELWLELDARIDLCPHMDKFSTFFHVQHALNEVQSQKGRLEPFDVRPALNEAQGQNRRLELFDVRTALNEVQSQDEQIQPRDIEGTSSQQDGSIQIRAAREARKSNTRRSARMRSQWPVKGRVSSKKSGSQPSFDFALAEA